MSEPKRYEFIFNANWGDVEREEDQEGDYVSYEDYASLKAEVEELKALTVEMDSTINVSQAACREYKAEVERLTEAGDELIHGLAPGGSEYSMNENIERWNAAKEGKPRA